MEKLNRIQFDLTDEALQKLDELKVAAHAKTRAELIRKALELFKWYLSVKEDGYKLLLRKDRTLKEILPLL